MCPDTSFVIRRVELYAHKRLLTGNNASHKEDTEQEN